MSSAVDLSVRNAHVDWSGGNSARFAAPKWHEPCRRAGCVALFARLTSSSIRSWDCSSRSEVRPGPASRIGEPNLRCAEDGIIGRHGHLPVVGGFGVADILLYSQAWQRVVRLKGICREVAHNCLSGRDNLADHCDGDRVEEFARPVELVPNEVEARDGDDMRKSIEDRYRAVQNGNPVVGELIEDGVSGAGEIGARPLVFGELGPSFR